MALLLIDGFDHSAGMNAATFSAALSQKWGGPTGGTVSVGVGGRSGVGGHLTIGQNVACRFNPNSATATVGGAFLVNSVGTLSWVQIWGGDNGATHHMSVYVNASGGFNVYRGLSNGTLLGSTANGLVSASTWNHLEVSATLHDSAGTVRLVFNESEVLNLSGVDTKNGGTGTVFDRVGWFGHNGSGFQLLVDDLYIRDDLTMLGDVRVETLMPDGNGNSSQLVGSDGNSIDNYLLVDETSPNDADYAGSGTPGDKDTYTLADLTTTLVDVLAVQTVMRAAKSDSGTVSGRRILRSGGVDHVGTDLALATSFQYYRDLQVQDPATSSAWTPGAVNSLEAGWEVRS